MRRVKRVPVRIGRLPHTDDNYLKNGAPGLYPDPLIEIPPHGIRAIPGVWEALWFDFEPNGAVEAGEYPIAIHLIHEETGERLGSAALSVRVIGADLPEQTLIHTKWFHSDCLADYYGVEIFSEEYCADYREFRALRGAPRHQSPSSRPFTRRRWIRAWARIAPQCSWWIFRWTRAAIISGLKSWFAGLKCANARA